MKNRKILREGLKPFQSQDVIVTIHTIPHEQQRYETVGDWIFDEHGNLHITVSRTSDWKRTMLVAIHELIEASICTANGTTAKQVDEYDMTHDAKISGDNVSNPGSPYDKEHHFATGVEILLAKEFGVNWEKYEEELDSL